MTKITTFRASNMIFPTEKIYKNIKDIDINLRSLHMRTPACSPYILINCSSARDTITKFNHALDKVEESINKIKQKVKIEEIADFSFDETFLGITVFLYEAHDIEEKAREPLEKRFVNLAIRLWDLGVYPYSHSLYALKFLTHKLYSRTSTTGAGKQVNRCEV